MNDGSDDRPKSCRRQTTHTTVADIRRRETPPLSPNLIREPYDNTDHYLDTQFALLREELVRPLVEDVTRLAKVLSTAGDGRTPKERVDNDRDIQSNVYFSVRLVADWDDKCIDRRHGPVLRFTFDHQSLESVDLQDCPRLLEGSLVCLSCDGFQKSLILGVVSGSRLNVMDRFGNRIWDFSLEVDLDDNECRQLFDIALNPKTNYVAVESLCYLEGMVHSLSKLQTMPQEFPFKAYIVDLSRNLKPPPYLTDDTCYDMTCIAPNTSPPEADTQSATNPNPLSSVELLNSDHKAMAKKASIFDVQQFEAFYAALTKEFAVIQGPPGTGKTFVGLKIVKCLLDNEVVWNPSGDRRPILIVCYKNHALDQFLEGITKFNQNVVRIGGKSESEALKHFKLGDIEERYRQQFKPPFVEQLIDSGYQIGNRRLDILLMKARQKRDKYHRRMTGISFNITENLEIIKKSFYEVLDYQLIQPCIQPKNSKFVHYFDAQESENPVLDWLTDGSGAFDASKLAKRVTRNQLFDQIIDVFREQEIRDKETGLETDIHDLGAKQRLLLYAYWRENFFSRMQGRVAELRLTLKEETEKYNTANALCRRLLCNEAQVIGLTITGAAKHRELVEAFDPQIMIIEEAAEVLEGHVVASFPTRVEHVILVGDHKQLRPITNVRELTDNYNMDISLFERMVSNGMPFEQLELQHRMRPCISDLLKVADIYKNLRNAQKVTVYPDIPFTFNKNMYFIDHKHIEDSNNSRQVLDKSRSNPHEAKLVVELVKYFLLHGYPAANITVLTTYNAQLTIIKKLMFDEKDVFVKEVEVDPIAPMRDDGKEIKPELKVRVSSVDGFQGEENDIIIISFVRSSKMGSIGFLDNMNRVNVALSRARHGLFCVGNFQTMANESVMWEKLVTHLRSNRCFDEEFVIGCECTGEQDIQMPGQLELLNLQIKNGRCKCHTNDRMLMNGVVG